MPSSKDLLVEIGTEELPPTSLDRLRTALETIFCDRLKSAGFGFAGATSYATPRRLAVMVKNLSERAQDRETKHRGPAVHLAWDQDGKPTKALLGFAKSCGVTDLSSLRTMKTDSGEWVAYHSTVPGDSLSNQLEPLLKESLAKLPIERRMRWGRNRNEFVRPVKWLLAIHGRTPIPVRLFGLTAGQTSHGHRLMSPGPFKLASAKDYVKACWQHYVIAEVGERKEVIRSQLEKILSPKAEVVIDEQLLDDVTALVEWPVVLAGKFDEKFLELPKEVLISAMKKHQRYFHLRAVGSDALLPGFITVANIETDDESLIIAGNERVIRPRLADAAFFFAQDSKLTLHSRVEKLKQVLFQSELGTYHEKAERIAMLAAWLAEEAAEKSSEKDAAGGASARDAAYRVGLLCKADLVSDMVAEFPDLQGFMGACYARKDGEPEAVAQAIGEHYMPVQAGGELPETPLGAWVALADKFDTLVGLFGINQPPTGSRDPYALRRQARGIIRICIEKNLDLDLLKCLQQAADGYDKGFDLNKVHHYILERLSNWYAEQGILADVIVAVQKGAQRSTNLRTMNRLVRTLHDFRQEPIAQQIIAANKRVANILDKEATGDMVEVDQSSLKEEAEIILHRKLENSRQGLHRSEEVAAQLAILAALQPDIDSFFDKVLVMTNDETVKQNRLALLQQVRSLFLEVADFSLLQ